MSDTRDLTRAQLLHLVDRARRGSILLPELDDLHAGINATCDRVEFYEAATSRMRDRAEVATVRANRAEARGRELEAENAQLRDWLAHCRHKPRVTELEAEVADLTYDLYQSDDARAWVREQCDIRDHQQEAAPGQGAVQTAEVVDWLRGPMCGRELAAEARRAAEVEQLRATLARVQQLLATGPIGTCCAHLLRAALGHPQPTGTREHLAKGTNA